MVLYQRHVTDIIGRIYNRGIIVQIYKDQEGHLEIKSKKRKGK